ncbi:MAG: FRG domain-containing protein [Phycisphaerae bacterium]|nr:FRG domain-containing protein [Phycisphaerae bacterium]
MAWKECEKFTTWPKLYEALIAIAATDDVTCRGQGTDYIKDGEDPDIFSSLDRALEGISDNRRKKVVEREIAQQFLQYAPNYLPLNEHMQLFHGITLMILMRHYGAPTRLVDWTSSIWIGAYFAVCCNFDKDGIIWIFKGSALDHYAGEKYGHETQNVPGLGEDGLPKLMSEDYAPWVCRLMQFGPKIPRMIAQQGLFTVGGRLGVNHKVAIDEIVPDDVAAPGKQIIRISASLKPEILKALHRMGINGSTLFPGIDGVGKALTEFAHFPLKS